MLTSPQLVGLLTMVFLLLEVGTGFQNDLNSSDEDVEKDSILNYSALDNPFRVQKINLLWEKARFSY